MKDQTFHSPISEQVPDAFIQLFSSQLDEAQQPSEKRRKLNKKKTPRLDIENAERLLPGYFTIARFTLRLTFELSPSSQDPELSDGSEFDSGISIPVAFKIQSRPRGSLNPSISFAFETENHHVTLGNLRTTRDWFPLMAAQGFPSIYKGTESRTHCSRSVLKKAPDDDLSFVVETELLWRDSLEIPQRVAGVAFETLLKCFSNKLPLTTAEPKPSSSPSAFYASVHVPESSVLLPSVPGLDQLVTELYPFQRRAVRWLLEREGLDISWKGEMSYKPDADKYIPPTFVETTDFDGKPCYYSPVLQVMTSDISGWKYKERELKGGILAEEMGLGKTVEMLALICSHRRDSVVNGHPSHDPSDLLESGATLIITPPAILEQWKQEISRHAPSLRFVHYRGINDSCITGDNLIEELMSQDIVLTTYTVLQKEIYYAEDPPDRALRHAKKIPPRKSPLVQISWWRVAIDEAQMIETGVSNAARVAKVIPRCNAWAMSGTPLKGDMKDIFGLLSFLQYEPFCYSMDVWVRLYEYFQSDFSKVIGMLVLRHNKNSVRDELQLPRQKRVVITVPFTAVEEQRYDELFNQMADECGLDAAGGPLSADWDPNSRVVIERMRSWLLRLRQACLHPEVGHGPRRPFGGGGPLRSVSDVLEVMINQNETAIRTEERSLMQSQIRRGQIFENASEPERSLEIWLETLTSAQRAVKECRGQYEDELKRHNDRKVENADDSDGDGDKDELDELNGRLGHYRLLLRGALEIEHMCEFFIASARYQIKTNEELTVPGSEEFHRLENLEEQGYEKAKLIRREMLSDSHKKVSQHIERLKTQTEKHGLVKIPQLSAPEETGGIESRRMLDRSEDLYEAINEHTKTFNEWREHMLKLLLKPLVDEEDNGELQGDEYESSTKHQDELYVYMEGLRVLFAQHFDAVTGQKNTLIPHEVRQGLGRAALKEGPAPELYISLMKKCKVLKPERQLGSVRGLVNELRNLVVSLDRQDIKGSSRARAELSMTEDLLQHASRMSVAQSKAITAVEREMDRFRSAMNNRLEHYRQLQNISDTVAPYEEDERQEQHGGDYKVRIANETKVGANLSMLRSKRRYLIHLRDESGAEESVRVCVICQSPFEIGVLTVCGHKYCKLCFLHWWQQHHNCPVCKSRLGRHDFHQITYKPQDIVAQEEMPQQPEEETPEHHSVGNAIYSDISSGAMKEIQEIDIDGSFGTKIDTIARHLLWLRENDPGAKSIVFSQYRPFLQTLASAFTRFKIGFTTVDTRDGIEGFKKDASKECFLLHARAHSSGLNLVNATHVFLCEPLVNTAIELQAIARVHRIGQRRETTVWMYLVADTVEESIYQLSVSRRLAHIVQKHREIEIKRNRSHSHESNAASSSSGSSSYSSEDASGFNLKDLSENIIDAANTLEVEEGALGKVLRGNGEGERVDDNDLWQCLFGKARKRLMPSSDSENTNSDVTEQVENDVENEVGRVMRAEAASGRRNAL